MKGFVFLGPTLQRKRAQEILASAIYLPPVNAGDILGVLKYKPSYLAVIDGNFGTKPSVWHKEILYALYSGCAIYGASSMGALRAAELHDQGMVGVGQVFEWYRDGYITSDDEVALVHGPEETGYKTMSTALVDIRFAVLRAIERGLVSEADGQQIVEKIREQYFPLRTWGVFERALPKNLSGETTRRELVSNVRKVSVKEHDAERLLTKLSQRSPKPPRVSTQPSILMTSPMMALIGRTLSRPLLFSGDWLFDSDLFGRNLRFIPKAYLLTSIVARILSLAGTDSHLRLDPPAEPIFTAALKMYINLQIAQSFSVAHVSESKSSFFRVIEKGFQRAGHRSLATSTRQLLFYG